MYILRRLIYHNKWKSSRRLKKYHLIFTKFGGLVKMYYLYTPVLCIFSTVKFSEVLFQLRHL